MNFRAAIRRVRAAKIAMIMPFVLVGCAASTAEKEAAMTTYVHCLQSAAAQLDDGVSEVTGVALAVKATCAPQFNSVVGVTAQGMSFYEYQILRDKFDHETLPLAAEAVMQQRTSHARASSSHLQSVPTPRAPWVGSLQEASTAYQRGDYGTALGIFRPLAEQGDKDAKSMLGVMYDDGKGVAQDYAEAVTWFRKAAEQGEPAAQFMVGLRYAEGKVLNQDFGEAAKWLRLAVAQGQANAQKVLDDIYSRCPDLRAQPNLPAPAVSAPAMTLQAAYAANRRCDYATALRIFRPLADKGNAEAQADLGIMYDDGNGVAQDYAEAAMWYLKAASQGYPGAQYFLAGMYENGEGVSKDYTKAADWMRKAAEQGFLPALEALGSIYEYGRGVTSNPAEAAKWYRKAVAQGDPSAQQRLNALYDRVPSLRGQ